MRGMNITLESLELPPALVALLAVTHSTAPQERAALLADLMEDLSDLSNWSRGRSAHSGHSPFVPSRRLRRS